MSDDEKYVLEFINPVMQAGVNVTVRAGNKWLKQVNIGDTVLIQETNSQNGQNKEATIAGTAYLPFFLIPQAWLDLEHDPTCHDMSGLLLAMRRAYGSTFTTDEYVTVLFFTVS